MNKDEVDYLIEKQRSIAQHYVQRFLDHMCNNQSLYPEYYTNTSEDMCPSKDNFFQGWNL